MALNEIELKKWLWQRPHLHFEAPPGLLHPEHEVAARLLYTPRGMPIDCLPAAILP